MYRLYLSSRHAHIFRKEQIHQLENCMQELSHSWHRSIEEWSLNNEFCLSSKIDNVAENLNIRVGSLEAANQKIIEDVQKLKFETVEINEKISKLSQNFKCRMDAMDSKLDKLINRI